MMIRSFTERWLISDDGGVHRVEQKQGSADDGSGDVKTDYNVYTWTCACAMKGLSVNWVTVPPPPGVIAPA